MRVVPLSDLLGHPLLDLFREVIDEVFGHQDLDPVYELLVGPAVLAQDLPLLNQVNLQPQIIQGHVVAEVPIEAVGLLDQDDRAGGMLAEEPDHQVELRPTGLLGCLDVYELLDHLDPVTCGVPLEELELRRDRESFLLLLSAGDSGVDHSFGHGYFLLPFF
ncbi:MAG: hypothetical protein O7H41_21725 [Planctomycetota bacterium]|nr:hypothetical protein [Planctomycetota bacterium]